MGQLNEMQSMMLDMLKWFHLFCQKNNITYFVVGGTMLGAVRHHGFIPWDDDIDVGIPRKDYERLIRNKDSLIKSEDRYTIESYLDNNKDFEYPYMKVYDTLTTLIENNRKHIKRGIFIDIFPLDGIGMSKDDSIKNYASIQKRINFLMTRTCEIRRSRNLLKNIAIIVSRLIPSFLVNNHSLIAKINEMCSSRDFDSNGYVGNLVGNWGVKEIMPRAYFGKPTLYQFESIQVFGPEDYDSYLKNVYNNWELLPPIEKRKSQHDFLLLDLHNSYLGKRLK